jgi:hypothetical protein
MKTTFESLVAPPGKSPLAHARAAATTCAVISAALKFLVRPAWPVAQNGQFIPHPACEEIQTVARSVYFIKTDSTKTPSCSRQRSFLVIPPSHEIERTKVINLGSTFVATSSRALAGKSLHVDGSSL